MTIYAIGDIHGQRTMLEEVLERIEADGASSSDEVIFLGDYIDRGPDTKGVLEILAQGRAEERNWSLLMGNHDRFMLNYLTDGTETDPMASIPWTTPRFGGTAMRSYGIDPEGGLEGEALWLAFRDAVPDSHREVLESLVYSLQRDRLLFVHAGVRPGVPLDEQDQNDLIWIRRRFMHHREPLPWLVIHGHVALQAPRHFGNHVDLDGGAGAGRPLAVAAIEGEELFLLTPEGRQPMQIRPLADGEDVVG